MKFQSTLPARGATYSAVLACYQWVISIHAPRTGSDEAVRGARRVLPGISIHAPRTGSDIGFQIKPVSPADFNPRSPHGERRPGGCRRAPPQEISIHAPRTGSDAAARMTRQRGANFNPRSPHGERLRRHDTGLRRRPFQSTLPARGATAPPSRT